MSATTTTTTPPDPPSFTDETLNLWRQYPELNGRSRQRPSPEKLTFILQVLRGIYIGDATSCNKSHVRSRYRLTTNNDTLQYIPEDGRPPRTVINHDEAYGLIVESHLKYGHAGREKVFHYLKEKFYHITREEVGWVLRQCAKCKARCKGGEASYDNSPDMAGADADEHPAMDGTAAEEEEENYLPGAYTKKFNSLRAESKLDESEWMNLCLCVARDVRGPTGLDVMLENEDKAKAWEEHFSPLCDVYAERHWGTKMKGRWWAGDHAGDRTLIKDFLRRLFMNFFQKERIHRARIARKAAKGKKCNGPSSGPSGSGPSGGTTWMRTHPPIKIPATQHSTNDQDHSPCAQKGLSKKRQREMDPASLHYSAAYNSDGEPSQKNPRLERIMVLLSNAEREQEETPPDTSTHVRTRKRHALGAIRPQNPVALEPTPDAVFRLDPVGAVFPTTLPLMPAPTAPTAAPNNTLPSSSNKNNIPAPTPTPSTPQISADLLFMTYVQRDERRHEIRHEIRLIRGETLTALPFSEVLDKLRRKHRLTPRQVVTAVVLDFKGSKLCIVPEDEDCQADWETWVRVEGPAARQVEVEVKVAEVVG